MRVLVLLGLVGVLITAMAHFRGPSTGARAREYFALTDLLMPMLVNEANRLPQLAESGSRQTTVFSIEVTQRNADAAERDLTKLKSLLASLEPPARCQPHQKTMMEATEATIRLAKLIRAIEEEHKHVVQGNGHQAEWDRLIQAGESEFHHVQQVVEQTFQQRESLVAEFKLPTDREGAVTPPTELARDRYESFQIF